MSATRVPVDRSNWTSGPWDGEPDRVEWKTAAGLPGLIVRHPSSGHLCGYVAVPPGHPMHGRSYGDPRVDDLHVHGGITYGEACAGEVCHVPEPGEPDDVWWLGFDMNHYQDATPLTGEGRGGGYREIYRTVDYVREQAEALAKRLAEPDLREQLEAAEERHAAEHEGDAEDVSRQLGTAGAA